MPTLANFNSTGLNVYSRESCPTYRSIGMRDSRAKLMRATAKMEGVNVFHQGEL